MHREQDGPPFKKVTFRPPARLSGYRPIAAIGCSSSALGATQAALTGWHRAGNAFDPACHWDSAIATNWLSTQVRTASRMPGGTNHWASISPGSMRNPDLHFVVTRPMTRLLRRRIRASLPCDTDARDSAEWIGISVRASAIDVQIKARASRNGCRMYNSPTPPAGPSSVAIQHVQGTPATSGQWG
ncbi:hypothetical protein FQR65_LT20374 [Abscondita terminalis]|nr:hypothetical protein FQR65_LT20374 [Abscondita terminalis]